MTRQILVLGEVGAGRRGISGSVVHPEGKERQRSHVPLGGTGTAVDDGAGADSAGECDDEVVAPSAAMLSCDMPTSTHVGELRHATLRGSMRACRERWPERLLCRAGEVGASGLRLGERSSMRYPLPVALNSRLPNQITVPTGNGSDMPIGNRLDMSAT